MSEAKGTPAEGNAKNGRPVKLEYSSAPPPPMAAVPGGVRVGDDEITFGGGLDKDDATTYVTVKRAGEVVFALSGKNIDMDRSQGEVGLFVPDAGYPFGVIPDWLIKQRAVRPGWYTETWPPTER